MQPVNTANTTIGYAPTRVFPEKTCVTNPTIIQPLASFVQPIQSFRLLVVPSTIKEIFDIFWKSQHHGHQWPRQTWAVVEIGQEVTVFRNRNGQMHVEMEVLRHIDIKRAELPTPMLIVKIYMNYSPCNDCSKLLIQRLQLWGNVGISMHVTALYNIARRSCVIQEHPQAHIDDSSRPGLKELLQYGQITYKIQIKTFDFLTWQLLIDRLNAIYPAGPQDVPFTYQYNEILLPQEQYPYPNYTRAKEDMLMLQDLNSFIVACNIEAITLSMQAAV